jgi:hypothetical protein
VSHSKGITFMFLTIALCCTSHFHPRPIPAVMPSSSTSTLPCVPSQAKFHIRHLFYPLNPLHTIRCSRPRRAIMSSITPPSFVDDGSAFEKRVLHPTKWLDSAGSDTTSAYTGSYIDDGADMLLPSGHAPGFGPINPKFYKQPKRKEKENGAWNDDIQKAVADDIGRSLEKMRGIGGMEVKRSDRKEREQKGKRKDTVTIPLPRKWGTFVIKANDGRVIVIDEGGEFDSGPQVQVQQQQPPAVKWVKAPTTVSLPPSSLSERSHRHKDKKKDLEPINSLTLIAESEYEGGYIPSGGDDILSPTDFFMTGGANGWPSRTPSPIQSRRSSKLSSPLKSSSPIRSLPGSWPSPPQSPTKVSEKSTGSASTQSWGEPRSNSSGKSKGSQNSSRNADDNVSTKTCSTYKPATVEDGPDTSSDHASVVKEIEWDGSQKSKSKADSWARSHRSSNASWSEDKKASEHTWAGSNKSSIHTPLETPHEAAVNAIWDPPAVAPSIIHQNWIADEIDSVSSGSEVSTRKTRSHGHHDRSKSHSHKSRSHSRAPSEKSWDGYEKPKTMSEVSVAGTGSGSERSWPGSHKTHQSDSGHGGWVGSQRANIGGWGGERTDSEGGNRNANGYDEDNETCLNDSWSGVKVRVRSRSRRVGVVH